LGEKNKMQSLLCESESLDWTVGLSIDCPFKSSGERVSVDWVRVNGTLGLRRGNGTQKIPNRWLTRIQIEVTLLF
jgi:hypothetical protein